MLARLNADAEVGVAELAAELTCSEMTIRRDLRKLESEGLLSRTHGGATGTRMVRMQFAVSERARNHRLQKEAIGAAAAALVQPGMRVLLDTGTTTLAMAMRLRDAEGICVVTTSLAIVSALLPAKGIECMLVGGTVRDCSPDLCGPLMEENLSRLHADVAFVGCDGISATGELMTTDPRVARAATLMVRNSARVALLADSSKAGRSAFVSYGRVDEMDWLVTDGGMPAEYLDLARSAGVEVMVAEGGK